MALSDKTNLLVQPYVRTQYPVLDEGIKRYIQDELQRIESSIRSLALASIQVTEDPPEQPVKGMVRYAISPWNPGSGDGLYIYNGTSWVLV